MPPAESHSIFDMIFSSDPIVLSTLGILVIFSVTSWAIIFYKALQIKKARRTSQKFVAIYDQSQNLEEVLSKPIPREGNPLFQVFSAGIADILKAKQQKSQNPAAKPRLFLEHIRKNIHRAENDEVQKLEQLTPFLATTASACPFIGLFGTVWGILTAFWAIGQQKSSSLAVVGPYISEALVATAVGLAAAIPAVVAYNFFVNKIRGLGKEINDFSIDLENRIEREFF